MDAQLHKLSAKLLSRRSPFLAVLKSYGASAQGVLHASTLLESELKGLLGSAVVTFADAVASARTAGVLSEDAFHLATRLRHTRNSFAHGRAEPSQVPMLSLMAMSAAALVFEHLESIARPSRRA